MGPGLVMNGAKLIHASYTALYLHFLSWESWIRFLVAQH